MLVERRGDACHEIEVTGGNVPRSLTLRPPLAIASACGRKPAGSWRLEAASSRAAAGAPEADHASAERQR